MPEKTPDEQQLVTERHGHVLVVTMNRPETRNALSGAMLRGMEAAWDEVDSDPEIRACILTGAGGYFCAGADLKSMNEKAPGDKFAEGGWDLTRLPALLKGRRLSKPLIAAVEGPAIAGGTEILQGTDIRIAGRSARFGVAEAKWGLYPLAGSAVRLPRQIPYTVAMDLLLTARSISADEALEYGLIGRVVDDGTALDAALETAERIAANGPLAVQAIMRTVRATEGMHEEEAFRFDAEQGAAVFASEDAKIGPRAFARKETPGFTGK